MRALYLVLCLAGCADVGTVTVACTFDYTSADGTHETGDYQGFTADCDTWAEHGEVQMDNTRGACQADGIAAGAASAECVCTDDPGTCTFPNGTND